MSTYDVLAAIIFVAFIIWLLQWNKPVLTSAAPLPYRTPSVGYALGMLLLLLVILGHGGFHF